MSDAYEKDEYFALVKSIADFDQRMLTVKGWGVTLSLAALGLGFQYRAYGYFLIAAASSVAFWIIEHAGKRHQMRHYVRMREIEMHQYDAAAAGDKQVSSPRIDWSWSTAHRTLGNGAVAPKAITARGANGFYRFAGFMPHVAFPHAITLVVGLVLFYLGCAGELTAFALGSPPTPAK